MDSKKKRILNDIVQLKSSAPTEEVPTVEEASSSPSHTVVSSSVYLNGEMRSTSSPETKPSSQRTVSTGLMQEGMPFPDPTLEPTQEGDCGIRFDFNLGIRVLLPQGHWRVRFKDKDTATLLYETEGDSLQVVSRKRHFLNARIEVEQDGALVWSHDYDACGKTVAVILPGGTLGDSLGWFPYAQRFSHQHQCSLVAVVSKPVKELLEPVYPKTHFILKEDFNTVQDALYATYYLGLFFSDESNDWQPSYFRLVGLHRTAGHILGVDPTEEPPRVDIEHENVRPIAEPYVAVAVQASCACKMWNNPTGWMDTVEHLLGKGYRVVCIDREDAPT